MLKKIFVALLIFTIFTTPVFAAELDDKRKEIEELQAKLKDIQGQKQTLSQTISYLTTQAKLTTAQIFQTESEIKTLEEAIDLLSGKIVVLDDTLVKLTAVLVDRINASYKASYIDPFYLLFTSDGINDFFRRLKYFKVAQKNDRQIIFELETARTTYDAQKTSKEEKQIEVEALRKKLVSQKVALESQQRAKQAALEITKNDEKNYQAQLKKAMAELEAIQSIIAGRGQETLVGDIKEGDRIASVIAGASACSSGAHLHFEVVKNNGHLNPADMLSGKDIIWDNSPDGSFGFSGSWRWPIDDPVRITQGYGMTFYAGTLRYYGGKPHTGIDMINTQNYTVKAVKDGKLSRGAISCGGGTLRYVKVEQSDSIDTYYLHVNY